MKRVCIVGVGLIGGSLGLALRHKYHVVGWGRSRPALVQAKRLGVISEFSTEFADIVPSADIVVLCLPVQFMNSTAKGLLPYLKKGAVVTDVGSVKADIEKSIRKIFSKRKDVRFVGAHPLAGSEKSGVLSAHKNLFDRATIVLTGKNAAVEQMWKAVGGRILHLSPTEHDTLLALTSHLPHLLSFALFKQVMESTRRVPQMKNLVAGSFRDMTRIAASDPNIWTGIFEMNRTALRVSVKNFTRTMNRLLNASHSQLPKLLQSIAGAKKSWS